ncbi:hypothetical protein ACFL35_18585 [Candidatus Riflebacteria bacterium]
MNYCPEGEKHIILFLEKKLETLDEIKFKEHLSLCRICQADLADFSVQDSLLSELPDTPVPLENLNNIKDKVLKKVTCFETFEGKDAGVEPARDGNEIPLKRAFSTWNYLAMAACFIMLFVLPDEKPQTDKSQLAVKPGKFFAQSKVSRLTRRVEMEVAFDFQREIKFLEQDLHVLEKEVKKFENDLKDTSMVKVFTDGTVQSRPF